MGKKTLLTMPAVRSFALLLVLATPLVAEPTSGQVQIPLDVYETLLGDSRSPAQQLPARYALGTARVDVNVTAAGVGANASVRVELEIDVLEDDWTLIPVLPAGTAVQAATVDGAPVQLIPGSAGLAWSTNKAGEYKMRLQYQADASSTGTDYALPLPVPRAAAIHLEASLPAGSIEPTVIPGAGVSTVAGENSTRLSATVPATQGVQIAWRTASRLGHSVSRANYYGQLRGDAVQWNTEIAVELFQQGPVVLPLLPTDVALRDLQVDGRSTSILVEEDRFAVWISGKGKHRIDLDFRTPVRRGGGPPGIELEIPRIPVSRFELELPGQKDLTVTPAASVGTVERNEATVATVHVPMTNRVSFSWSEAVPEETETQARSNAVAFHVVRAEEGVLYVHGRVRYEVSRGETSLIELLLPAGVQLERIAESQGIVADWRLAPPGEDGRRLVSVFLDRKLQGELTLDVFYDRSLRDTDDSGRIDVPLLWAPRAQRQRGMVALLAGTSLALQPIEADDATKVGEDRLPPDVRQSIETTVAHTYKYAEVLPRLLVELTPPERVQGRFDAQVDTLVSLGEVTLTGSASVEVNVKSGRIMRLGIELPRDVSLLQLTGPSVRTHRVGSANGSQVVEVQFTREMEGQFRLDATYERILQVDEASVAVGTLSVQDTEVQRGRIAIEALSAVEVRPAITEELTALEIGELPRRLVLRTTNPILLAYKYVQSDPPHRLALAVTRHGVLGVQEATIDLASYHTLFTEDGLVVTAARFFVRNSRKQFLRVTLPEDAEVWSASVAGRPEKPAQAHGTSSDGTRDVLIKILNSTDGFPVELIYAATADAIRGSGKLTGSLPRPDVLVTSTRWDLYLPEGPRYGAVESNLAAMDPDEVGGGDPMADWFETSANGEAQSALLITVPSSGAHYAFQKLYANQSDEPAWFEVTYRSARRSGERGF